MQHQKGFTLLEVLVSIAIMGLIMMLIWSATSQSLNSKDRIEKRDMAYQYGRVAMDKITNDLTMLFISGKGKNTTTTSAGFGGAPVELITVQRPITFLIGEDNGDIDKIRFTSMSHLRLFSGAKESDQCKVSYEVVNSKEYEGGSDLVRTETPWLDQDNEVKGSSFVIAENISGFDLEYYDDRKDEWAKEWNTEEIDYLNKLPKAVSVTLSLVDPDDKEKSIPMKTIVLLPMADQLIDF